MSKKLVTEFLDETKEAKLKQLMGIAFDLNYWKSVVKGKDVDDMRKELSEHQKNIIKTAKGQVLKDNRDMDQVNRLVAEIDQVEKANGEIERLKDMDKNIRIYLKFIMEPPKDVLKTLEGIAKM